MYNNPFLKTTEYAKLLMKKSLKKGDIVLDATMGNGNDTLFLAELVGKKGKVFAFDIQQEALCSTKKLLEKNAIESTPISLILDGHENIDRYIKGEILSGAMFNLGYLPGGDKDIMTRPETTIVALQKCLGLLKEHGLITIVVYPGHPGGQIEKEQILLFGRQLSASYYHVLKANFINQRKDAPFLIAIFKK